ncbi:Crp/Fnr family transcriptional regulator [Paludibacterium yongneupense]|uniref:Crp/Fnr family transcriptional regulator n=1 Tax=Paludibacterium yongneupense TaxID=400061 RepID=UPI0006876453|nr:Crp/Fnr family transcriptional regulator [Paludibacterium yongneupense]
MRMALSGKGMEGEAPSVRADRLERVPLLTGLPEALLAYIHAHGICWHAGQERVLYVQHDQEDFIAFVLEGCVQHVLHGSDGREIIVTVSGEGDVLGEAGLFDAQRHSATARALENTTLWLLSRRHFPVLLSHPPFVLRIQHLMCRRMREVVGLVESVCLHRLESRLARYLLDEAERHGRLESEGILIPFKHSQSTVASMLNASRPKLNAQLQSWSRSGLILRGQHVLLIPDLERLRRIAVKDSGA